jgi:hypothetical protein
MHLDGVRVASVGLLLLGACEQSARPLSPQIAGGESTEFSGGDVPVGFCPEVLSSMPLDLKADYLAVWVALVEGHHEIPLRWRREFPSEAIRGFEETTDLSLDVTVIAAETVVCGNGGYGGYEVQGLEGRSLRRFELAIELASADGAIRGSFQTLFFPQITAAGRRVMSGGAVLAFEEVAGTLELGVDPELDTATQTLNVSFGFDEQGVSGSLTPWVTLPRLGLGDTPFWAPVNGVFPAPDPGCDAGQQVELDTPLDLLGRRTPRAAYEAARSRFPAGPIKAAWEDQLNAPRSFAWTEVNLGAGSPAYACLDGVNVQVYTSLRIESADGLVLAEPSVVAHVSGPGNPDGTGIPAISLSMSAPTRWTPSAEFMASSGMRDLDLGLAEYAAFSLYQSLNIDSDTDKLQGQLNVEKWENYFARSAVRRGLLWCAGADCERDWCIRAALDDGSSCL